MKFQSIIHANLAVILARGVVRVAPASRVPRTTERLTLRQRERIAALEKKKKN